jgi:hypothetical protein
VSQSSLAGGATFGGRTPPGKPGVGRYGDQPLLITSYEEEGIGRDVVIQSPSNGDQHVLQDRGRGLHRTRCKLAFCDEPGRASYQERWLAFRTLAASSTRQLFVHPDPNVGTYQAQVAELGASVSGEERCVYATCVFIETSEPKPVAAIGAGAAVAAGPEAVTAQAAAATAALGAVGVTSSAPASCAAAATGWAGQPVPDARAIALEVVRVTGALDDLIVRLTSPSQWRAYRELVVLRYAVARAAAAVTSETQQVTRITLEVAEPLLTLCARTYGARDAQERARQVAKLNGLRTPGLVPAGTALRLPVVRP